MSWEEVLKVEESLWNAYIRDSYRGGELSKYVRVFEAVSGPSATPQLEEEAREIETDSQEETFRRFKAIMAVTGMTVQGDKNEGMTRYLSQGFLQSTGPHNNFWYVISQTKPEDSYIPDFNPHTRENVGRLMEE